MIEHGLETVLREGHVTTRQDTLQTGEHSLESYSEWGPMGMTNRSVETRCMRAKGVQREGCGEMAFDVHALEEVESASGSYEPKRRAHMNGRLPHHRHAAACEAFAVNTLTTFSGPLKRKATIHGIWSALRFAGHWFVEAMA